MNKCGLVLEGGGLRGIFTAGILDYLMEQKVNFSDVIGVSAGAIHGCNYRAKQIGRSKACSLDYLDDKRYCSLYSLITTGNMFGTKFTYYEIPQKLNIFDNNSFIQNQCNLYATVTNVETGEAEYIKLEDMNRDIEIVRASASLPLISKIVHIDGKKYLDGGIADSIPIKAIEKMNLDKIVVILTQPEGYRKEKSGGKMLIKSRYRKYPKFIERIENRYIDYNKTLEYVEEQERLGKIFVMRPYEKLNISRIEKDRNKLEDAYQVGYDYAKEKFDELIGFLEK